MLFFITTVPVYALIGVLLLQGKVLRVLLNFNLLRSAYTVCRWSFT